MKAWAAGILFFLATISSAEAAGPIGLIDHKFNQTGSTTTNNLPAFKGTGASLLTVEINWRCDSGQTVSSVTDSSSNTWTALTQAGPSGAVCSRFYYKEAPAVSASQTVTVTFSAAAFSAGAVQSWGGTDTPTSFDVATQNTAASGTTISTGAIVPTGSDLVITMVAPPLSSTGIPFPTTSGCYLIDGGNLAGFSILFSVAYCGASSSINPSWQWFTAGTSAATVAAFKGTTTVEGSSKTNDYGIFNAGTASQLSSSKTNDYVILAPVPKGGMMVNFPP